MAVPWTLFFWLGVATLCGTNIWMVFDGKLLHAVLGMVGATLMFFGSKVGREFLGII